jgi:TolA-binding protein
MISNNLRQKIRFATVAFSLLFSFVLLSSVSVQAQWRDRDDRRNERRNDRWGNTNKRVVENTIRRVEQRTNVFVQQVDRALDNSRADGTRREDRINELARQLENATDELRTEFDRSDSLQENRDEVQRIIRLASQIEQAMRRARVRPNVTTSWRNLKTELNSLARVYNVNRV